MDLQGWTRSVVQCGGGSSGGVPQLRACVAQCAAFRRDRVTHRDAAVALTRFVERLGRRHGASEKSERPDGARERRFVQAHVDKTTRRYAPSFFEGRGFLNETHPKGEELVDDIRGKLEPGDHAKLYEAGYFARGPVLEIGGLHGRSTVVLAMGIRDGGGDLHLTSIEYEDQYLRWARRHLKSHRLLRRVTLLQGDSSTIVRGLEATFDTVFVDGDHSYDGVMAVVRIRLAQAAT